MFMFWDNSPSGSEEGQGEEAREEEVVTKEM